MQAAETHYSPLTGLWNVLKHRWDELALGAVTLSIIGMIAYLLWPQPVAEMSVMALKTSLESANVVVVPPEAKTSSESDIQTTALQETETRETAARKASDRKRSVHGRKKPDRPPILNINTASASQLQLLPGIGPKMAALIIQYRKVHGTFSTPEQIMDVKGIGPKKFEKMQAYLRI